MRNVTLQYAHMNNLIATNHLFYKDNEIVSITPVNVDMLDENGENVKVTMYDVYYINRTRNRLDTQIRVDVMSK